MVKLEDVGKSQVDRLMHSANNCHQMLGAIERKLARALECIDAGETDRCRELLVQLTQALPQAMDIINHKHDGSEGSCG